MKKKINRSFNLDELNRLTNGDEQFIIEMIGVFIKTTEEGMIDMEEAIKENNYAVISAIAHKIAPPCRHMGAEDLLDILKKIENYDHSKPINGLKILLTHARNEMTTVFKDLKAEDLKLSE